jgi:O-antigen/teichoic acid export membrane protein
VSGRLGIRGAVRGFAALAGATVAGQIIGFVALAIVARRVGPENLGDYAFAAVFTSYVLVVTDLGLSVYGIREIAREPERTREIAGQVLTLRFVSFVSLAIALVPLSVVLAPNAHARTFILILTLGYLPQVLALDWVLRARGSFAAMAALTLGGQVIYGALVPVLVTDGYSGTKVYAWLNVVGFAITFVGASVIALRRYGVPLLPANTRELWTRLRSGAPLGVTLILGLLFTGVNTLLLGYLGTPADVGVYGVALRIPLALTLLASVWISAFLPHASELATHDPRGLLDQIGRLVSLAIVVALPIAAISAVIATPLMRELFGPEFAAAGAPFRWLMLWASLALVATNFNNALLALDEEKWLMAGTAGAVLVTMIVTLALIPPFGTAGAGAGALLGEIALVACSIYRLRRKAGRVSVETGRVLRSALVTAAAAGVVLALRDAVPAVVAVAAGGLVFAAGAVALGAIAPAEVRDLLRRAPAEPQPATAASSSSISGSSTPGA